jgi:hypothetical protein
MAACGHVGRRPAQQARLSSPWGHSCRGRRPSRSQPSLQAAAGSARSRLGSTHTQRPPPNIPRRLPADLMTEQTRAQVTSTEAALAAASNELDTLVVRSHSDAEAVRGPAGALRELEGRLDELGAGTAMEEVQRRLKLARQAVERLGRSELSIKAMKQPPPVIRRVITAVYLLLHHQKIEAKFRNDGADANNPGRIEWGGGPYSCRGMLGRRTFTDEITSFDVDELCDSQQLLHFVSNNFIGSTSSEPGDDRQETETQTGVVVVVAPPPPPCSRPAPPHRRSARPPERRACFLGAELAAQSSDRRRRRRLRPATNCPASPTPPPQAAASAWPVSPASPAWPHACRRGRRR